MITGFREEEERYLKGQDRRIQRQIKDGKDLDRKQAGLFKRLSQQL